MGRPPDRAAIPHSMSIPQADVTMVALQDAFERPGFSRRAFVVSMVMVLE